MCFIKKILKTKEIKSIKKNDDAPLDFPEIKTSITREYCSSFVSGLLYLDQLEILLLAGLRVLEAGRKPGHPWLAPPTQCGDFPPWDGLLLPL